MNRTISCTVNEEALARALAFLGRNNYGSSSLAGIARLSVELIAMQLEGDMTDEEVAEFHAIAHGVGRTSATRPQLKGMVMKMQPQNQVFQSAPQARVDDRLWWQQLGCCSEEEGHRYTQFLRQHGITARECSYSDWHKHQLGMFELPTQREQDVPNGCDPSLPIAAQDTDEELMAKARERELEQAEQKRLMDEAIEAMKASKQ